MVVVDNLHQSGIMSDRKRVAPASTTPKVVDLKRAKLEEQVKQAYIPFNRELIQRGSRWDTHKDQLNAKYRSQIKASQTDNDPRRPRVFDSGSNPISWDTGDDEDGLFEMRPETFMVVQSEAAHLNQIKNKYHAVKNQLITEYGDIALRDLDLGTYAANVTQF